jgi:hypothetical protein
LPSEQCGERFGFAVRQEHGVIVGKTAIIVGPYPGTRIAFHPPGSAFDFYEPEALLGEH